MARGSGGDGGVAGAGAGAGGRRSGGRGLHSLQETVCGAGLDVSALLVGQEVALHVVEEVEPEPAHGTREGLHAGAVHQHVVVKLLPAGEGLGAALAGEAGVEDLLQLGAGAGARQRLGGDRDGPRYDLLHGLGRGGGGGVLNRVPPVA